MLRRSWPPLIEHLASDRQMILKALLESRHRGDVRRRDAGAGLPAGARRSACEKVEAKPDELRTALGDLFGIKPRDRVRGARGRDAGGGRTLLEIVDEEDTPTDEEALRRVQEMLGAQVTATDVGRPGTSAWRTKAPSRS